MTVVEVWYATIIFDVPYVLLTNRSQKRDLLATSQKTNSELVSNDENVAGLSEVRILGFYNAFQQTSYYLAFKFAYKTMEAIFPVFI